MLVRFIITVGGARYLFVKQLIPVFHGWGVD